MSLLRRPIFALFAAAVIAAPASAPAQAVVETAPLPAPDLFSAAGRETGLPDDLWKDASAETMRQVLPLLAEKPLSPAASALARRVLAAGARGPKGAGEDPALAAARVQALTALGDVAAARAILGRTAGVERSEPLSRAAAEAALLSEDEAAACGVGQALSVERDQPYWLRLRAYCQARAGEAAAARLTFDLAETVAHDAAFARLMGARLAGGGEPKASLRDGLDYALSRDLGLDLSEAKAAPGVAAALAGEPPPEQARWEVIAGPGPVSAAVAVLAQGDLDLAENVRAVLAEPDAEEVAPLTLALLDAMIAAARGRHDGPTLDRLVERGGIGAAADRRRAQDAALLLAAHGAPLGPDSRGEFARFPIPQGKAPPARLFAMEQAAQAGLAGETVLLALWTCAEAGEGGPASADRARIVRALQAAGLEGHAREFVLEGLLALR